MWLRVTIVAALLGGGVGCAYFYDAGEPHFTEETELTEPWAGWALPVQEGKVTVSDGTTLSVHHKGLDAATLGPLYAKAVVKQGWKLEADTSAGGVVNQTYRHADGRSLALSVLDDGGTRIVSLTVLPF